MIRVVWATPSARETFSQAERDDAVVDYNERGPQFFANEAGAGFAIYEYPQAGTLIVAVARAGKRPS